MRLEKTRALLPIAVALIFAINLAGASTTGHAMSLQPIGVKTITKYKTWSSPLTTITVYIEITEGDINNFASPRKANIGWDYQAVTAAMLLVHKMRVLDDKNRPALVFIDAKAGGVYKKSACYHDSDFLDCFTIYKDYKKLGEFSFTRTVERTFYVEASTEAEAEARLGLVLGGLGVSFSVKSMVKVGSYYAVTVSMSLKRTIVYLDYETRVEHEIVTPEGNRILETRRFILCPQETGWTLP